MDGVLAEFDSRYEEKFGEFPEGEDERRQHFWDNWKIWVDDKEFEKLELHSSAKELLDFITILAEVEILTSTSGGYSHDIVAEQKQRWLHKHNINFPLNAVPGGSHKARYANNKSILIDDSLRNIDLFAKAGGYGILHISSVNTIKQIKNIRN